MREFQIGKNEAGQRFDKYLKKLLCNATGSFIYKMLRKKNIVLNDKKADGTEKLQINDNVKLYFSEETFLKFTGTVTDAIEKLHLPKIDLEHLPFEIVKETEEYLIINKPVGMLSQKAAPTDISANEYILSYLIESKAISPEEFITFKPSVCNRLDRNTSGILIAGKTLKGLQDMAEQLKSRSMKKYYQCIVEGNIYESAHIKGYLRKDEKKNQVSILDKPLSEEDKYIETEYIPLKQLQNATLLEVHLITGRSHQIRAHLASIGHPILGDSKYGGQTQLVKTQLLHACRLELESGEKICASLPKNFGRILKKLEV